MVARGLFNHVYSLNWLLCLVAELNPSAGNPMFVQVEPGRYGVVVLGGLAVAPYFNLMQMGLYFSLTIVAVTEIEHCVISSPWKSQSQQNQLI